jgi:hypothetical protein
MACKFLIRTLSRPLRILVSFVSPSNCWAILREEAQSVLLRDWECKSETRETLSLKVLKFSWMKLIYTINYGSKTHVGTRHQDLLAYLGVEGGHVSVRVSNVWSAPAYI